jgi:hypothetical protein
MALSCRKFAAQFKNRQDYFAMLRIGAHPFLIWSFACEE